MAQANINLTINRREMISALGLTAVGAAAPSAASALTHQVTNGAAPTEKDAALTASSGNISAPNPYANCIITAKNCVASAEICLTKMVELLAKGEETFFECAVATRQMLPICEALLSLSAQESPLTTGIAKLSIKSCTECAAACKPHIDHHPACQECYLSCLACIKSCREIT
ncbi:Csp1 family four helix bundle copper storage protein [Synechococcus sp. MIT S9509]|uniref:Csp1 family four helix bundle copper storage protein n=1 Tax=Synechococcus sp. MIT S9509 TaxID=1801630 RepID=UPI003516DDEE